MRRMVLLLVLLLQDDQGLFEKANELYKQQNYYEAYHTFSQFIIRFPNDNNVTEAKKYKMESARQLVLKGFPFKVLGMELGRSDTVGIELLRQSIITHPKEEFTESYIVWLGDYFLSKNQIDNAEAEYNRVIKDYKKSPLIPDAIFKTGECYIKRFNGLNYDYAPLKEALLSYERVIKDYPDSQVLKYAKERYDHVQNLLAKKEFNLVEFYLSRGKPKAAKIYLESIVKKYPETPTAIKAKELLDELEKNK